MAINNLFKLSLISSYTYSLQTYYEQAICAEILEVYHQGYACGPRSAFLNLIK